MRLKEGQMSVPRNPADSDTTDTPLSTLLLLVDITATGSDSVAGALTGEGYRVVMATNPRSAVDLSVRERADLLMVDQEVLERDGSELMKGLDGHGLTLPVIGY